MIYIAKPLRKKIALALAAEIGRLFETEPQKIELEEGMLQAEDYVSAGWPLDRYVYAIPTGELSIGIDVCPREVSLYCRLRPNGEIGEALTEDEKRLARRVDGNHFSGKVNLHMWPERKVSESDIEGFVLRARNHILILKDEKNRTAQAA